MAASKESDSADHLCCHTAGISGIRDLENIDVRDHDNTGAHAHENVSGSRRHSSKCWTRMGMASLKSIDVSVRSIMYLLKGRKV